MASGDSPTPLAAANRGRPAAASKDGAHLERHLASPIVNVSVAVAQRQQSLTSGGVVAPHVAEAPSTGVPTPAVELDQHRIVVVVDIDLGAPLAILTTTNRQPVTALHISKVVDLQRSRDISATREGQAC
jgi:hypothetical protein